MLLHKNAVSWSHRHSTSHQPLLNLGLIESEDVTESYGRDSVLTRLGVDRFLFHLEACCDVFDCQKSHT